MPNLTDNHSSAQLDVTLHRPTGNLEALVQQPAARIEFRRDWVLQARWGVGRVMTVYDCDLTDHPPVGQGVKLI